ncbi:hypothetical protein [Brevundimonas sp.]
MIITALALVLALPQEPITLTFVHGDEQIVTWLDRASMRRTGDKERPAYSSLDAALQAARANPR